MIAKILRLYKQKKFLIYREAEITKYSLKFLDELNTTEEQERLEKERQEVTQQAIDTSVATNKGPMDSDLTAAFIAYNPSNPF